MINLNEKLFEAVRNNETDKVLELIEMGADIKARNRWSSTLLHVACCEGKTETALILIEKGADVGARNQWGETPLDWASEELKGVLKEKGIINN